MKIQNTESLWRKKSKSQSAGGSGQCILPPISSICHSFRQPRKGENKEGVATIQITVGSTGRYYEVGRRGAIKTEEALRKLLVKDIADGYFGQSVIPNAPSIIDQAVKVYRKLTEEDNE